MERQANDTQRELSEKDLERLRRLRPIDDDFMRCLYRDNLPLAQDTLRIVTGMGDLVLSHEETQKDLKRLVGSRSIELDVWGKDSQGREYDLEVQTGGDARPKRARYHGSAMDVEDLRASEEFERLPERWVIFLMEEDPFGMGRDSYLYEMRLRDGHRLKDGSRVLYVNGASRSGSEVSLLMQDFLECDPDKMRNKLLAKKVRYLKTTRKGMAEMCKIFEEIRQEGIELGIERGDQGRVVKSVRALKEKLRVSATEALDMLDIPRADQARYLALL